MTKKQQDLKKELYARGLWIMEFDGATNKCGVGTSVWIKYAINDSKLHSLKLSFCRNNRSMLSAMMLRRSTGNRSCY